MTPEEFAPIAALIDNSCKDGFDDGREAAFALVLGRYPALDVRQAVINVLGKPGPAWAPSTREIAAEIHAVQFVGTSEWARQTLKATVSTMDVDDAFAVELHGATGQDLAVYLLAAHPEHGKRLLALLEHVPLRLANHPNWWEHGGHQQWDQLAYTAIGQDARSHA